MKLLVVIALWLLLAGFTFKRTDYTAPGANGQGLYDVALADLDGAKGLDIVVSAYARNKLLVLRNQGNGTFTAPVEYDACGPGNDGPWQIATGEFSPTPDGKTDVAVACGFVTIVPGNGAGGLTAPQPTAYPSRGSLAAGEFNGGGNTELLFGGPGGAGTDVICMMFQPFSSPFVVCGNPTAPQPPPLMNVQASPRPGSPTPVVAEVFNPVGHQRHDEVFGLSTTVANEITFYARAVGDNYNSWNAGTRATSSNAPYFVDTGDVEGDGDVDVLVGHKNGGVFDLFLWSAAGLAVQPKVTSTLGFETQAGELADFDRDGKLDAAIAGGQGVVSVHKGKGDGTFAAGQTFGVVGSSSAIALAVGDVNTDARPDIVVIERHTTPATPNAISVLTSIPPIVTPPPKPPILVVPSPATGIKNLKASLTVARSARLVVGRASNPPTASTIQTLTARGKVLGRGRTTIAAGQTKPLSLKLTRKVRKRLKRTLRARLTITATGPTGTTATIRRTVKLKPRRK